MDSKRVAVRGKRSGPTDPKVRPETPLWQVYGASIRQEREKSPLAGHMEAMSSSVALHSGSLPHNAPAAAGAGGHARARAESLPVARSVLGRPEPLTRADARSTRLRRATQAEAPSGARSRTARRGSPMNLVYEGHEEQVWLVEGGR